MISIKRLTIVLILLFALPCLADNGVSFHGSGHGVAAGGGGISEDFTSCSEWTTITGSPACDGQYHAAAWGTAASYHQTSTGSNDNWSQATIYYDGASDSGWVVFRSNGTTYYKAYMVGGNIVVRTNGGSGVLSYSGSYSSGTYLVKAQAVGTTITVWVDSVQRINGTDSNISTGTYVGVGSDRDNTNTDCYVDDMTGGAV